MALLAVLLGQLLQRSVEIAPLLDRAMAVRPGHAGAAVRPVHELSEAAALRFEPARSAKIPTMAVRSGDGSLAP